jgi:hypothetical protein
MALLLLVASTSYPTPVDLRHRYYATVEVKVQLSHVHKDMRIDDNSLWTDEVMLLRHSNDPVYQLRAVEKMNSHKDVACCSRSACSLMPMNNLNRREMI